MIQTNDRAIHSSTILCPDEANYLLDATQDAILVISTEGRIIYANKGIANMVGMRPSELIGADLIEVLFEQPDSAVDVLTALDFCQNCGRWAGMLQLSQDDEISIQLQTRWSLLSSFRDHYPAILMVATDTTEVAPDGDTVVLPDRWYHFALVHEGTPDAARIRWYLNHERCGEILLGGQANQNTLRPPGSARITIGARLIKGTTVDRGFNGYMDEIRLTPKTLRPVEFLRTLEPGEKPIDTAALRNQERATFWKARRAWAIEAAADWMPNEAKISFPRSGAELLGDAAFLRRLALTVTGRIPTLGEIEAFLADSRQDKRSRAVERYLASPEWGDDWVGYWQDVLAENPTIVNPTLNNTGPFRWWLYESFLDNKPIDRLVSELVHQKSL